MGAYDASLSHRKKGCAFDNLGQVFAGLVDYGLAERRTKLTELPNRKCKRQPEPTQQEPVAPMTSGVNCPVRWIPCSRRRASLSLAQPKTKEVSGERSLRTCKKADSKAPFIPS